MRGQRHVRPQLGPGKDPVPIVQEAGWASGPVWTGVENLALTGIRSPDRRARRQSLYRLHYPAHATEGYSFHNSVSSLGTATWYCVAYCCVFNTDICTLNQHTVVAHNGISYIFIILYSDQQMHNYFTNYHTATCFDIIVSSSDSL